MNEVVSFKKTISSVEIAEISGKNHKDVLKSIRNMEPAWEKVNGRKFAPVEYVDAKGEKRPMYELTGSEFMFVISKFNDEARAKLILRWEQLETDAKMQRRMDVVVPPWLRYVPVRELDGVRYFPYRIMQVHGDYFWKDGQWWISAETCAVFSNLKHVDKSSFLLK